MNQQIDLQNPFNVTKATDFSNQEIAEYWVDFYTPAGHDLAHYLNPLDLTPKYIIGGKGCGKTHLLRYFSFPLQKLRRKNDIKEVIGKDQYIGLNIDLGAMNSARMYGCNINEEQWDSIFGYYLELFSGLYLFDSLIEIFCALKIDASFERLLIEKFKETVCYEKALTFDPTLKAFRNYINDLKKEVDYHINNAALTRSIDFSKMQIKLSPGDIFFKVPTILSSEIDFFREVRFIFILDELEKLREYQKVYVNTVIWDKKRPTTFWIGARTFGFTTRATKAGETLRNGSEYQEIRLDELMQEDEVRFRTFSITLCAKRLSKIIDIDLTKEPEVLKSKIDSYFVQFDELEFFKRVTKNNKKELPHEKNFKEKLKDGIRKKLLIGADKDFSVDGIFKEYFQDENKLYEKYKIYHFYRLWVKPMDLNDMLKSVKAEFSAFCDKKAGSKFSNYEEKFKLDFLSQLIFENNEKLYSYTGVANLVKISSSNPRAFLVLLKEIFERAKLNHESPFEKSNQISVKTQSIGIYQASKWFYEDTEAFGDEGRALYRCTYNLATLLQGIRFADKPSETSPSSFSYKPEKTSAEAEKYIELAVSHRILVPVRGRHDKNSERVERSYQLNRMLAPYFNLPISRRGIVPLNEQFVESIFNPTKHNDFQNLFKEFTNKMNAPFGQEPLPEMF